MVIDFSTIGTIKDYPVLVLCNADDTAIQPLGYAINLKASVNYNEVSSITFDVPAYANGDQVPHYDDIIGMRIIDMIGWGRFILTNPSISNDGVEQIKNCKAYSLEYELTYKKTNFPEDTYNFWNPLSPDDTVLGIIISDLPSWSIGSVDGDLINKYRTFSAEDTNIYNFMKSTLQETYNCIFDFDTYERKINVRSTTNEGSVQPVYLSLNNLIKNIEISEDTENIFTVLDVSGGEDVNIRAVNPLGTNKIYNLDYFMNTSHFSQSLIDKWESWKSTFASNQQLYYNTSVERTLKTSAILTEQTALEALSSIDLASLQSERSVYVEFLAQISDKESDDYKNTSEKLKDVNIRIEKKNDEIAAQTRVVEKLKSDDVLLSNKLASIIEDTAFSKFFTDDEMTLLSRYFKEDSIEESSFVVSDVSSYQDTDISSNVSEASIAFDNCNYAEVVSGDSSIYTLSGGTISCVCKSVSLYADIVRASIEYNDSDKTFVLSAYLNAGSIGNVQFPSGNFTMTGSISEEDGSFNVTGDSEDSNFTSKFEISAIDSKIYFTRNATEYEKQSVAWELFEYGEKCLESLAYPTFSFSITSGNFFALDEFASFVSKLELGQRIYLNTDSEVLQPIFIGADIEFDNLSSISLKFSDKYSASDSAFKIVELLDQSISMGKTVESNKLKYSSFVNSGASTKVKDFMDSALDVAKNSILTSSGQGVSWDETGIHLRKYINSAIPSSGYEDEQMWMINNNIVFTDDGWNTVKMAIGKVIDENIARYQETADTSYISGKTYYYKDDAGKYNIWVGTEDEWDTRPKLYEKNATAYGIVAPYIVGTMIAGQNLVITTEDGSFTVDSSGVHIDSMKFYITHDGTSYDTTLNDELSEINTKLSNCLDEDNYLKASNLKGIIDTKLSTMQSGTGNVVFDDNGIWLLNSGTKESATQAIWMNESGILFGSGSIGNIDTPSDETGAWNWTTAISHDGVIADAMATKVLNAFTIKGGSIDIGDGKFRVDSNGNLYAETGTFKGTLSAPTLSGGLQGDDDAWLIGCGIKVGQVGDADNYNFFVDQDGNVTMNGSINMSNGKITWSSSNSPVKVEYSATGASWHESFAQTDYYARYSYDGGMTWTDAIRIQGKNGSNGSDADVPSYIKSTYIDATTIKSPTIEANEFNVYPGSVSTDGSFNIYGHYNTEQIYHMLSIRYTSTTESPNIFFESPADGYAYWKFPSTNFYGNINFSNATVTGLNTVAYFG